MATIEVSMSNKRYADEFNSDAVKQVVDRRRLRRQDATPRQSWLSRSEVRVYLENLAAMDSQMRRAGTG